MPPQPPFLLDTNVLVALIRRKELGGRIEQAYGVASNRGSALISVVTVGEMFSLARQWSWPENKVHELAPSWKTLFVLTSAMRRSCAPMDRFIISSFRGAILSGIMTCGSLPPVPHPGQFS